MGQGESSDKRANNGPKDSDSLDKVERELALEQAKAAPPLEIQSIDELPQEYKDKLVRAKIDLVEAGLDDNLDATLNILHFLYKRRFKRKILPKKEPAVRDASPGKKRSGKKRRGSSAKSLVVSGATAEEKTEDATAAAVADSPIKRRRHRKKEQANAENGSEPESEKQDKPDKPEKPEKVEKLQAAANKATDSNHSVKDKALPDDELTENELAKEHELINTALDPSKIFKSFQAHGSGGFGTVERAKNAKTKEIVAVKHVPHTTIKQKRANIQEIDFLTRLRGKPNIVEFHTAYKHGDEVWMIMEFMEGGTLSQALKAWSFKEPQIAYFAREVLKGLRSLHANNMAHRDIKPHNIMLDVDGFVKLIDFGLCIDFNENKDVRSMVGSAYWMAPEMIARKPHGPKVDIFSLGMVIYELMSGEPLTSAFKPLQAMYLNGVHGGPPVEPLQVRDKNHDADPWSNNCMDFLRKCLTKDADERPSAEKLLEHPFLKKADSANEMKRILKLIFLSNSLQMQGIGI